MRKFFSKAALAATLALTMIAAPMTAFAAGSASVNVAASAAEVKAGDTVSFTVTVSSEAAIGGVEAAVAASEGLENPVITKSDFANDMSNAGKIVFAEGASEKTSGTVTYTYTVTAAAGETVSFSVSGVAVSDANADPMEVGGTTTASATVVAATPDEPTPDDPTPVDPTPSDPTPSDPTPSNPTPSDPTPSTPGNQSNDNLDDVPQTGDASSNMMVYVVVAIAAAGAIAVVSAKKFAR